LFIPFEGTVDLYLITYQIIPNTPSTIITFHPNLSFKLTRQDAYTLTFFSSFHDDAGILRFNKRSVKGDSSFFFMPSSLSYELRSMNPALPLPPVLILNP
jgi:hypothetical protein